MKEEVKNFVEKYNDNMDWNKEILESGDLDYVLKHDYTKALVEEYLPTEKINEEDYDLENAKVYTYEENGTLELQVFSNKIFHGVYFWVKPYSKEEYISFKLNYIKKEINSKIENLENEINEAQTKLEQLNVFKSIYLK